MPRFLAPLIAPLLLLPALWGCSHSAAPASDSPLSPAALAAVKADPGVGRERLARAVNRLFTDPAMAETRAVIVMHGGRMVAERYAPGYTPQTRFVSWSMAKSITGVMIGMLIADGRLRLNESAPVPAWQRPGDPRGEITLKQLLQMRSGLNHTEAGDPIYSSDEVRMLFRDGRDNMAAYAEAQPLEAEPGAKFEYSTATTVILADIATRALVENPALAENPAIRRRAMDEFLRTRLFEPIGMHSMVPEYDRFGTLIGGSLIHGTARDWAKFGEFLRAGGSVRGAQLIPRGWIDFMTHPSPRNAAYGAQIWLNHRPSKGAEGTLFPGHGPASLFSCVGHLGQYVIVSPRQDLVIVRLGKTNDGDRAPMVAGLAKLVDLFPAR
ncbi:serine hydrolase domain-containing protein [Novosphingobium tardum]|uniref:Serine hydrolase domain-containing protein n=1 Tax=Novosphingobium tardum TaxID=1538021 RepID=A0ABV8RP14_9SPHN